MSSEGAPTAEWAEQIASWNGERWGIEEFRVLKRGTRIEARRTQQADALVQCLAFDPVKALRVFNLGCYAQDEPATLTADTLTDGERKVIGIVARADRLLPPEERDRPFPSEIGNWVMLLGRMTGGRKLPGSEVLWRAYVRPHTMVLGATNAARSLTEFAQRCPRRDPFS
ncbi:MAG: hypothetical protein OXC19_24080 [Bryobacterales bacterium]|nr:hypothetical protein [Bryobacterales bacterium]